MNEVPAKIRYGWIRECQKEIGPLPLVILCAIFQVSRSGYYKDKNRKPTEKDDDDQMLTEKMIQIAQACNRAIGYRRLTLQLCHELNRKISSKRIYRLMKQAGLKSKLGRQKKRYTPRFVAPDYVADHKLDRDFTAEKSNQKWVTDITYLQYGNGETAYLSAILDLGDRSIVAYALQTKQTTDLVLETLHAAHKENPAATPLFHSDRGCQYTSHAFKAALETYGYIQSMSRPHTCADNSVMEAFWSVFKNEKYYPTTFNTFDEVEAAVDDYIFYYNHKRCHTAIGGQIPAEYRKLIS